MEFEIVTGNRPPPARKPQMSPWLPLLAFLGAVCAGALVYLAVRPSDLDKLRASFSEQAKENAAESAKRTKQAKAVSLPMLKKYGIISLDNDAALVQSGGELFLVGTGLDTDNGLRRCVVKMERAQFGPTTKWKVLSIAIDDRVKYSSE